jgi:hypothetical protein
MRSAVNQANNTYSTSTANAGQYGGSASGINGQITPFLENRLNNAPGYSQADMSSMLANTLGSSGGATSGLNGQAALQMGRTRNDAGFGSALDAAARERTKANAGIAEGIQGSNADLKQTQSNNAEKMLQGLYGTDVGAQEGALNTANGATDAAVSANKTGWLQNTLGIVNAISGAGQTAAGLGFKPGCWIAAELYGGWDDPRTIDVRRWIFGDFAKTYIGGIACAVYLAAGERTAQFIREHRWARKPFRKLFDMALSKARA